MTDTFETSIANRDAKGLIEKIPYAVLIGIESLAIGEDYVFKLPKNNDNLGNPSLPAIHGGVIGGFMESAGALHVMLFSDALTVPKVVDFSIDYLSPGRHLDSYARCHLVRQGRKIANIRCTAAQAIDENNLVLGINWDKPIAVARMNILMT
jgi:acyl-coenzyme A thioesterase PaaI-like protein